MEELAELRYAGNCNVFLRNTMFFPRIAQDYIPDLMRGMPRCLLSPAELHDVIQNTLEYWAMDTVDKAWGSEFARRSPPAWEAHSRHLPQVGGVAKE